MKCNEQIQLSNYQYLTSWDENSITPPMQVVTCFLQNEDKVLVLQRARKDKQYKLWGIPGGKLDKGENPIEGLIRELQEEINVEFSNNSFSLLAKALSITPTDGQYGLYIYHAICPQLPNIFINNSEHYAFRWVTLTEFLSLPLLTAQGEAFQLVENQLNILLKENNLLSIGGSNDK